MLSINIDTKSLNFYLGGQHQGIISNNIIPNKQLSIKQLGIDLLGCDLVLFDRLYYPNETT